MMDDAQLAEIAARAEAATPGPWESEFVLDCDCYDCEYEVKHGWTRLTIGGEEVENSLSGVDAAFIAAARADVPLLLAEVKRLRAMEAVHEAADAIEIERLRAIVAAVEALPEKWADWNYKQHRDEHRTGTRDMMIDQGIEDGLGQAADELSATLRREVVSDAPTPHDAIADRLRAAAEDLYLCAERVRRKFGADTDWTEWSDLKESLDDVEAALRSLPVAPDGQPLEGNLKHATALPDGDSAARASLIPDATDAPSQPGGGSNEPGTSPAADEPKRSATDDLVDRFAVALKAKLRAAEAKYEWNDGWKNDGWADDLRARLREHVKKGDPRDVAAFCAFAWHHGWSVGAAPD